MNGAGEPRECPKYLKLAKTFERQLRAGVLRVGDRLPSVRQLRTHHRVSAATAVGCYMWLERQGYVRARPKSGFFVSRTPQAEGPAPEIMAARAARSASRWAACSSTRTPRRIAPASLDLGPAVVGAELLPMARLNRSIRLALSAFGDNAVKYEEPRGNVRLRRQIAKLVFRQGATCSPDDIVVTSGWTEAFNLSVRAIAKPGDVVAVETPGCYEVLQRARGAAHARGRSAARARPGHRPQRAVGGDSETSHQGGAALRDLPQPDRRVRHRRAQGRDRRSSPSATICR